MTTPLTPDAPRPEVKTSHYFGGCPQCGETDGFVNVGRAHWFTCDEHRTAWCIGSNLFSGWREETDEIWDKNAEKLKGYTVVEPIYPDPESARTAGDHMEALGDDAYPF
jgi:hypothetical protein